MSSRDDILGGIRRALGRGRCRRRPPPRWTGASASIVATWCRRVPRRSNPAARINLFVAMAEEVQTTVTGVAADAEVPAEVALSGGGNLPAKLVMAPDPALDVIPWGDRPLLQIRRGRAEPGDAVSVTPCLAAIARPAP